MESGLIDGDAVRRVDAAQEIVVNASGDLPDDHGLRRRLHRTRPAINIAKLGVVTQERLIK